MDEEEEPITIDVPVEKENALLGDEDTEDGTKKKEIHISNSEQEVGTEVEV